MAISLATNAHFGEDVLATPLADDAGCGGKTALLPFAAGAAPRCWQQKQPPGRAVASNGQYQVIRRTPDAMA